MRKLILVLIALLFATNGPAQPQSPRVISVILSGTATALQFDIVGCSDVRPVPALLDKTMDLNVLPNGARRVLVYGLNQSQIPNGMIAVCVESGHVLIGNILGSTKGGTASQVLVALGLVSPVNFRIAP